MPKLGALGCAICVCLVSASPVAAQVTVTPTEKFATQLLAVQNAERARLKLKPLVWSAKLADHARKWAQTLATSDMFEHSPVGADGGEGENLWTGTRDDYTTSEMVGAWIGESALFKRGRFPDISTNGRWEDVGHYSQIVWTDTREVGCAIVSNPRSDFLVCRYLPAGNITGKPVYDYKAAAAIAVTSPVKPAPESEIVTISDDPPAKAAPTKAAPAKVAPAKVAPAKAAREPVAPPAVSPSKPKKPASKKHRRGG